MNAKHFETDIVLVGAGPVGLFAIFQAGMLKMRVHVVDALSMAGGQCAALYPEKPIYDIPGHPSIDALDLVQKLEAQAAPFKPVYHFGERVESVERRSAHSFRVTTSGDTIIDCKAILIAAGCGAFGPNRPPVKNIGDYEGKSVFYFITQREAFRNRAVVIAGGGDSAVDWAISLSEISKKLYVVHRRAQFRCAPTSQARLEALTASGKVELVIPYQLEGLKGEKGALGAVIVKTLEGAVRELPADVLLPFFGLAMELGPIAKWGLGIHENRIAVNPTTLETSERGIFAIGDIATYSGKLKLILCGFSEAAMALHAICPLVHPGETLHFEYSTTKGIPIPQ